MSFKNRRTFKNRATLDLYFLIFIFSNNQVIRSLPFIPTMEYSVSFKRNKSESWAVILYIFNFMTLGGHSSLLISNTKDKLNIYLGTI